MPTLLEEFGIEEDSRYASCFKEAMISLALFAVGAAISIVLIYGTTAGRQPQEYQLVLGLPAYLFWGIIVTHLAFLAAVVLTLRFVYQDMPLDPADPADGTEQEGHDPSL